MINILESSRLRYERPRPEHADTLARLIFNDSSVMEFSDGPVDARKWIADAEKTYEEHHFSPWVLTDKNTGEILGYCGLFDEEIEGKHEVTIGYRLSREAQGQGFATEAVRRVLEDAGQIGIERVVALIDPANMGSIHVAEKAGFTHERNVMMEGYTHPDGLYVVHP